MSALRTNEKTCTAFQSHSANKFRETKNGAQVPRAAHVPGTHRAVTLKAERNPGDCPFERALHPNRTDGLYL